MYRATHDSRHPQYGGRGPCVGTKPRPSTNHRLFTKAIYSNSSYVEWVTGYWEYAFGIKIHNNGLPGEGEILSFSLDVSRIIGNCPFYIVLMGRGAHADIVVMSKI